MMVGEIAALSTALCWAVAARMFRILGKNFSPLALNLWKGLAAIGILLVITQFFLPQVSVSTNTMLWLLFSGVIGIGLGDTFFFQALNKIGDSQSILVAETLAPIFTALLAMAWIAEWLTWQQWCGIALVLFSVDMIIKIQKRSSFDKFELSGYVYAGLAALCQAVGAVVSRDILTSTGIDAFNASQIRLLGGLAIIVILMLVTKQKWLPTTDNLKRTWLFFSGATVIGTFAALYLQMVAFTYTKAAVVQTLFAMSVILSLVVAKILGEKVSGNTTIWSLIALIGVGVLVGLEHI
ncbi:DMT family transporter [Aliiglaciecola sp. 2_MG-2023]|uniref:DMT family transporter n=1 Tax=unclassified Aliiglaciecola TaxID=2593648 RepID=UPI0026E1E014|nr:MULTISPECIES: DMT family transporter [unclassified Aliiglaciecola]MDO6713093.1 DMT family transporter [Aliiglaciecola sp. 2_MG-2023]MDO6754141.1 DMT family transporter [Aliiglaciecola sp. 1_MG-2023]